MIRDSFLLVQINKVETILKTFVNKRVLNLADIKEETGYEWNNDDLIALRKQSRYCPSRNKETSQLIKNFKLII